MAHMCSALLPCGAAACTLLHSPELFPKCMNTLCTDHFLMIAVCAHSRRLPEVIFLVFSKS